MQLTETVWTILVGDHPRIIPVKFGQNPMSGLRGEDVKVKLLTDGRKHAQTIDIVLRWAKKI